MSLIKYPYLWIFLSLSMFMIVGSTKLINTTNNAIIGETCDEGCLLSKHRIQLKSSTNGNGSTSARLVAHIGDTTTINEDGPAIPPPTCSFQGIDTSPSNESFRLFDGNPGDGINISSLINLNGSCICSSSENYKHAVITKVKDNKITLTDAYIACGETEKNDDVLERLLLNYINEVPERALGKRPVINSTEMNQTYEFNECLDEDGFLPATLSDDVPCFSYISAVSTGTYSRSTLKEGATRYYSGPYSVNRINQSESITHPKFRGKNFSMLGLFHALKQTCDFKDDASNNDHCHLFFNSKIYAVLCCCWNNPGNCAFRKYKNLNLICAQGSYSKNLITGQLRKFYENETDVTTIKNDFLQPFCSSQYTLKDDGSEYMLEYKMPAEKANCNAVKNSENYCLLDKDICPSNIPIRHKTKITCCCREPDFCNVDFVKTKAIDRINVMKDKVCEQSMIYSILFAGTNYTLGGDDKQPLCYVHYDVNQPNALYFLANHNLQLVRDEDYNVYRKVGCNIIAGRIMEVIAENCPDDHYSRGDTKIPRPLLVCTCKGERIGKNNSAVKEYCDEPLRKNLPNEYNEVKDTLMPKCLVTKSPFNDFNVATSYDQILSQSALKISTKSIFCYMALKQTSGEVEMLTSKYSLSGGIASVENEYGEKCFEAYKELPLEDRRKPFCLKDPNGNGNFCCIDAIGKDDAVNGLLYEIKETLVRENALNSSSSIQKYYGRHKSLRCSSNLKESKYSHCELPLGCFWTENSKEYYSGCIDKIPNLLATNSSNPIFRALRSCTAISRNRQQQKLKIHGRIPASESKEPYRCFATTEKDANTKSTNVYVVCCCTEINENGECKKNTKKVHFGKTVHDVVTSHNGKQSRDRIYQVPY